MKSEQTVGEAFDELERWYRQQPWWLRLIGWPTMLGVRKTRRRLQRQVERALGLP